MSQDQQSKPPEGAPRPTEPDGPNTWSPEKHAEVERMGREAMERMRAAPAVMAGPPKPRPRMEFEQAMGRCETHGEYPLNFQDVEGVVRWHSPNCPTCARQAQAEKLMARAAISPRFIGCTFESFRAETEEQRQALGLCLQYATEFRANRERGTCLILRGNPGTGKNHLATAIARTVLAAGFTVMNATAHEVIRRVRSTWSAGATETEDDVYRKFADLDLLIVDEVGRTHRSKDDTDPIEVFNVIDGRYRLVRPTVVISNLDKEGLQRAMGQAAYDRLREGGARIANFDWDSARG